LEDAGGSPSAAERSYERLESVRPDVAIRRTRSGKTDYGDACTAIIHGRRSKEAGPV
jgi:hypothetical protein